MKYETVIGLEIHAELSTKSKIFCGCTTDFGMAPNTSCCPVCTGMPGTLPVLNRKVVEYAVKAGIAMNCEISKFSRQDRKNYFYPDMPKAYQVSQYDLPLCKNGYIMIDSEGTQKRIGITRIHIEEDAGKLLHCEGESGTLIDFNRCGVPLIEIVTEPDIRSSFEARALVESVKAILEYLEVSDCKMQEGSLRIDVNVSVKPVGSDQFGTRTEMKNLNSLRSLQRAIENEAARQMEEIRKGRKIVRETRRWDDSAGCSYSMRDKEEVHDYRYFPEPDLMPVKIDDDWLEKIRNSLPELPSARKARYISEFGLPEYDAGIITSQKQLADFFEETANKYGNPKVVSNWIMGDIMRILNARGMKADEIPFPGSYLADLLSLIDKGVINRTSAAEVLENMFETGREPGPIISEKGLEMVSDDDTLTTVVRKVLELNPKPVAEYRKGKEKVFGYLVGQVMRETKGKADPQKLGKILKDELSRGS
ncbi:MAG: Asp-tRNA(Asn)/Glu-tRNA(Gln) amidotransferase subunit GatB [Acetivibrionales bacterium]|jgi:aspartyl-tRNA(Asn)/glutamyl-tRNA(Gln) amidotransferase subunit B